MVSSAAFRRFGIRSGLLLHIVSVVVCHFCLSISLATEMQPPLVSTRVERFLSSQLPFPHTLCSTRR